MTRAEKGFTFFWASVTGPQISLASKLTPVPLALLFVLIIHFANPRVSHFSLFPIALSHTVEATLALSARPYTHAHNTGDFSLFLDVPCHRLTNTEASQHCRSRLSHGPLTRVSTGHHGFCLQEHSTALGAFLNGQIANQKLKM